jgi:enoyl-CoA hydratase/carnithine racemase
VVAARAAGSTIKCTTEHEQETNMTHEVLTSVQDGVGTITINRPELMNAVNPAVLEHVIAAIETFDADDAVRVMVLTGAGKAFCAGGDRPFLATLTQMTPDTIKRTIYRSFLGTVRAIKASSKPVIASVNGAAVGAGCEFAVACDFRIVSTKAFFWENWIDLGLIAPLGGMVLLPQLIGLERATNMLMRSVRVYGEEAKAIGLATEVCAPEALAERTQAFAVELAQRPRQSLAILKQGLRRGAEASLAGEWEFSVQAQSLLFSGPDFAEAISAIENKRAPVYK